MRRHQVSTHASFGARTTYTLQGGYSFKVVNVAALFNNNSQTILISSVMTKRMVLSTLSIDEMLDARNVCFDGSIGRI
jgi:hypothetical protein